MDTIKMLLLDVKNEIVREVDIDRDSELSDYYRLLGVDYIDIVQRTVDGKEFDIICDDEGLFREPVKISAIDKEGSPMLVGNLLFAHHDAHGEMTGLESDEIEHLKSHIGIVFTEKFAGGYPAIYGCWYS